MLKWGRMRDGVCKSKCGKWTIRKRFDLCGTLAYRIYDQDGNPKGDWWLGLRDAKRAAEKDNDHPADRMTS